MQIKAILPANVVINDEVVASVKFVLKLMSGLLLGLTAAVTGMCALIMWFS